MIWFTSDMHLGHEKALDFTCRPWNQIDEMNEGIIANYICLFDYLFISSQMSAKPYFIGSTGILLLW